MVFQEGPEFIFSDTWAIHLGLLSDSLSVTASFVFYYTVPLHLFSKPEQT